MMGSDAETLGVQLEESVPDLYHPPNRMSSIGRRMQQRKRRQFAVKSASIVAVVAIGAVLAPHLSGLANTPEKQSALGSASATSLETADWTRAVIDLPAPGGDGCPTGRTVLQPKTYARFGTIGEAPATGDALTFQVLASSKVFGDLTGDGNPEAVLHVRCTQSPDGNYMVDEGAKLLVVQYTDDGSVRGLGYIGPQHAQFPRYWIADGKLHVQTRYQQVSKTRWSYSRFDVGFERTFAWAGDTFRQVSGRATPLVFEPENGTVSAPIQLADIRDGDKTVCGKETLTLRSRSASVSSNTYTVEPYAVVDLDGDGNDEVLATVRCQTADYDAASVYVFGQSGNGFTPVDVPFANSGLAKIESIDVQGKNLTVNVNGGAGKQTVSMSWIGHQFTPAVGSYRR
jgi:hypothetical protein